MDSNFYYTVNGIIIHDIKDIPKNSILQKNFRLCGGKGGFGSMLRAIGSQIEKTTNREMCRDLNGRRMRDVNNETRLKEWLDKADSREREKLEAYLEKRRKRKILLEQGPSVKIPFEEKTGADIRQQMAEELQDAIAQAFEQRKIKENEIKEIVKPKKMNFNIDADLESSDSSASSSPVIHNTQDDIFEENNAIELKPCSSTTYFSEDIAEFTEEPCAKFKKLADNSIIEDKCPQSSKEVCQEIKIIDNENSVIDKPNSEIITDQNILKKEISYLPINLDHVGSVNHLLTFGPDWLKNELINRGLKCGGTLMEKAQRLFSVKGLSEYPENLLIGYSNKGNRKRTFK